MFVVGCCLHQQINETVGLKKEIDCLQIKTCFSGWLTVSVIISIWKSSAKTIHNFNQQADTTQKSTHISLPSNKCLSFLHDKDMTMTEIIHW